MKILKTKKYVAFVRDSKTKELMVIEREYPTTKVAWCTPKMQISFYTTIII